MWSRTSAGESVAKCLLVGIGEGSHQRDTAIVLDLLKHLVCNHFPDEHKHGGVARTLVLLQPFRIGDELLASSAHDGNQLIG